MHKVSIMYIEPFHFGLAILSICLGAIMFLLLFYLFFFVMTRIKDKELDWDLFSQFGEASAFLLIFCILTYIFIVIVPYFFMKLFNII